MKNDDAGQRATGDRTERAERVLFMIANGSAAALALAHQGFKSDEEFAQAVLALLGSPVTDKMIDRALEAASGAMVDTRRHWTDGDRAAVRSMLEAAFDIRSETGDGLKDRLGKRTPNFEAVEALNLPTPRLQFRWERLNGPSGDDIKGDDWLCHYELVIRLEKNDIRNPREYKQDSEKALPLGGTKVNTTREPFVGGKVTTPFRDGAHMSWDSAQLGIRHCYAVYGEHVTELPSAPVTETEPREVPDPEADFEGCVSAIADNVIDEMKAHPQPEYWVAKSAARLNGFVEKKAPSFVIENEKRLLARRVAALPVYCANYDELKGDNNG